MTEELDDEAGGNPDEAEERLPLSELRERIEAEQATAAETERSELFEEVDVGDIDAEAVWEAIVEEGVAPEEALGELGQAEPAEAAELITVEPAADVDEHVIDKREYCQRCEFFSEPPEVGCTNRGTEILQLVDTDSFRVRNCPKVEAAEEELSSVVEE